MAPLWKTSYWFSTHRVGFRTLLGSFRGAKNGDVACGSKKIYKEEQKTIILQRRSLRAARDIKKGSVLTQEMIDILRPAPKDSIYPKYIDKLVGSKVKQDMKKGEHFRWNLID